MYPWDKPKLFLGPCWMCACLELMPRCSTSGPQALSSCILLLPFHLYIFISNLSHPGLGLPSQKISITFPQHSNDSAYIFRIYQFIPCILDIYLLTRLLRAGPIIYFWFILVTTLCLPLCIVSCSQMFSLRGELCQRVIKIKAAQYEKQRIDYSLLIKCGL